MNYRQVITNLWLIGIVSIVTDFGVADATEKKADVVAIPQLTVTLEPALSDGFTTWEGYNNLDITYEIEVMSGSSVVETISTSKNYYKFDQVTYRNHNFRVKAIDSNSREVIGVGPQDRITVNLPDPITKNVQDPTIMKATCTKICNGPTYAWKMQLMQEDTPGWSINSPAYLALRPLYEDFDITPGATNPTWEAMSPSSFWDSINQFHYSSHNHLSFQVILPATPSASSPQIVDAYGATMSGETYFVQKHMEQFDYANNNVTNVFSPSGDICGNNLTGFGGWIDRFNTYPDPNNMPPSDVNDDPTLSCTNTPGGYSGTGGNEPNYGGAGANAAVFYFCSIEGIGSFMSTVPCDTYATGDGNGGVVPPLVGNGTINWGNSGGSPGSYQTMWGGPKLPSLVDHVELDPLSDKGHNVILGEGGDFTNFGSVVSPMTSGLYKFTVFTKDGRGFPRYVEIVNNTSVREFRD